MAVKTNTCRAKNPENCRYHGKPMVHQYDKLAEYTNESGIVPQVLFEGRTVARPADFSFSEIREYEYYGASLGYPQPFESYGFAKDKDEEWDLAVYIEAPITEDNEADLKTLREERDKQEDPRMKARYDAIIAVRSKPENEQNSYLENLSKESSRKQEDLMKMSEYETSLSDAYLIHAYGKEVNKIPNLSDAEKAIVLWESLKKHEAYDQIDQGKFGSRTYKDVVMDTWNIFTYMEEDTNR